MNMSGLDVANVVLTYGIVAIFTAIENVCSLHETTICLNELFTLKYNK